MKPAPGSVVARGVRNSITRKNLPRVFHKQPLSQPAIVMLRNIGVSEIQPWRAILTIVRVAGDHVYQVLA